MRCDHYWSLQKQVRQVVSIRHDGMHRLPSGAATYTADIGRAAFAIVA